MKKFGLFVLFCFVATGAFANVASMCHCVETYPVDEPILLDVTSVSGEYWGDFHSKLFGTSVVMCDYFPTTPWSVPGLTGWFCTECCGERMFVSGNATFRDDFIVDIFLTRKLCCGEVEGMSVSFTAFFGVEYGDMYSGWHMDSQGEWAFYVVYLREGVLYVSMGSYTGEDVEGFYNYFTLIPTRMDYVPHPYPTVPD